MTALAPEPLTAEAFAPFGRVVDRPAGDPDATGDGFRWWARADALPGDERPYAVGYLDLEATERRFDWAERHERSEELVVPVRGACLLYAGPAEDDEPNLDRFRVFRLEPGQGALLGRGVWHGAPLAVDDGAAALVFLLEGTGQNDTRVVRFPETPVEIKELT